MKFEDVKFGQLCKLSGTGKEVVKISDTLAVGTQQEYCGKDWTELRHPYPSEIPADSNVYDVKDTDVEFNMVYKTESIKDNKFIYWFSSDLFGPRVDLGCQVEFKRYFQDSIFEWHDPQPSQEFKNKWEALLFSRAELNVELLFEDV